MPKCISPFTVCPCLSSSTQLAHHRTFQPSFQRAWACSPSSPFNCIKPTVTVSCTGHAHMTRSSVNCALPMFVFTRRPCLASPDALPFSSCTPAKLASSTHLSTVRSHHRTTHRSLTWLPTHGAHVHPPTCCSPRATTPQPVRHSCLCPAAYMLCSHPQSPRPAARVLPPLRPPAPSPRFQNTSSHFVLLAWSLELLAE